MLVSGGSYQTAVMSSMNKLAAASRQAASFVPTSVAERTLAAQGVKYVPVSKHVRPLTSAETVAKIAGGDKTSGSCASQAITYLANRLGLDVEDYRGGVSGDWFSKWYGTSLDALEDAGATVVRSINTKSDWSLWLDARLNLDDGKEYLLGLGRHATVVKIDGGAYYYLELQSYSDNGWKVLDRAAIRDRFKGTTRNYGSLRQIEIVDFEGVDITSLQRLCGFINTKQAVQMKGATGGIR